MLWFLDQKSYLNYQIVRYQNRDKKEFWSRKKGCRVDRVNVQQSFIWPFPSHDGQWKKYAIIIEKEP